MSRTLKKSSVLPGFGLALGWTLFYLCLIVLIPLSALFIKGAQLSWAHFWNAVASPRAPASYRLSFGASLVAALINAIFGLLVASSATDFLSGASSTGSWTCPSLCRRP